MPILMQTMNVHWKSTPLAAVFQDPDTGFWHLNTAFREHCEQPKNWSVGSKLLKHFPGLLGRVWIDNECLLADESDKPGLDMGRPFSMEGSSIDVDI